MRMHASPPSIFYLLEETGMDDLISFILKGHLVLDSLLVEILKVKQLPVNISFSKNVEKLKKTNILNDQEAKALQLINYERNNLAHILGHELNFQHAFNLAQKMHSFGVDFSDGLIHSNYKHAQEYYGIRDVFFDVFHDLFLNLADKLVEHGGIDYRGQ